MHNQSESDKFFSGKTLAELGERAVLRRLCEGLPVNPETIIGPGDDCAVVRAVEDTAWDWLIKSDPLIENVHFTADTAPEKIGHKALARVLSDIAAMGGEPLWININLTAPPQTLMRRIEGVYAGLAALANRFNASITGGDIAAAPQLALHVFGVGRVPRGRAILRAGARPGDLVMVTGRLGGSRAGRHLDFEPRLREGQWLQTGGWTAAMIDISDGLASDLHRIAESSGVGAEILAEAVPVAPESGNENDHRSPLEHALTDGEDFELLFTLKPDCLNKFTRAWREYFETPCSKIGTITENSSGIRLRQSDGSAVTIPDGGYDHYAI